MISLQEFLDKYLGKTKGYPDSSFMGECLSVCKLFILECFGINPPASGSNSAYGYWSNFPNPLGTVFEKVENTADLIPKKGWIAIWKPWTGNIYGHIAIVADGSTAGTLKNYAQNWTSRTFQLESNKYTNVVGFLKPKESIIDDMINEEQKRILDFLTGKTEGDVREAFGTLADLPGYKKINNELADKVSMQGEEIDGLKKTISDLFKDMDKINLKYGKLLEEHNILMAKYQALQEVEPNCQTPDYSAKQLFILLIHKIFKK